MSLVVRPATVEDSGDIWEWRNDPASRAVSGDTAEVPWSLHQQWYAGALADPARHLLVAEVDGAPVGVVRFDQVEPPGTWRVSINLAPAARGRRLGPAALNAARGWLGARSAPGTLEADIRAENRASLRAFESAGYVLVAETNGWLRYHRGVDAGASLHTA